MSFFSFRSESAGDRENIPPPDTEIAEEEDDAFEALVEEIAPLNAKDRVIKILDYLRSDAQITPEEAIETARSIYEALKGRQDVRIDAWELLTIEGTLRTPITQ